MAATTSVGIGTGAGAGPGAGAGAAGGAMSESAGVRADNGSQARFRFFAAAKFPDARNALTACGGVSVGVGEADDGAASGAVAASDGADVRLDGAAPDEPRPDDSAMASCRVVWDSVKDIPWKTLSDGTIVNHFQRMHEVGRKSNLCRHLRNLQALGAGPAADASDSSSESKLSSQWDAVHSRCWLVDCATELHWFINNFLADQALAVLRLVAGGASVPSEAVRLAITVHRRFEAAYQRFEKQFVGSMRASDEATPDESVALATALQTAQAGADAGDGEDIALTEEEIATVHSIVRADHAGEVDNVWIVKPSHLSKGQGIQCFRDLAALLSYCAELEFKVVAQRYITRPLVIRRKKVDVRQWVLVTDVNPITIWFFRPAYVRFCATNYDLSTLEDRFSHLCNRSVAKHSAAYAADSAGGSEAVVAEASAGGATPEEVVPGNMWTSQQLRAYLHADTGKDVWVERIRPQMEAIAVQTMKAAYARLDRVQNGFEWLGIDYLIEDASRGFAVRLLEVNVSPDITHTTAVLRRMVPAAHEALVRDVLSLGVEEASTASDGTAHKPVVPEPCASVDDATLRDSDLVWEKVYTGKVMAPAKVTQMRDKQTRLIKQQQRVAMLRVLGKRCAKPADVVKAWAAGKTK